MGFSGWIFVALCAVFAWANGELVITIGALVLAVVVGRAVVNTMTEMTTQVRTRQERIILEDVALEPDPEKKRAKARYAKEDIAELKQRTAEEVEGHEKIGGLLLLGILACPWYAVAWGIAKLWVARKASRAAFKASRAAEGEEALAPRPESTDELRAAAIGPGSYYQA